MQLYENELWLNDIDTIINNNPEIENFNGKTILITGATGLICSSIVDVLLRYNEKRNGNIRVVAAGRSRDKLISRFGPLSNYESLSFIHYDATRESNFFDFEGNVDYIIHGASNAFPSRVMKEPVETMMANLLGMKQLLDYAKKRYTKKLLFISSSEVYGKTNKATPLNETDYGFIDLLEPRNSYSISKRATETLCISYAEEYGVKTVIARPGHIYGPTASDEDSRVSSAWAYSAANGVDIVMKSEGLQLRSYCYSLDCASALLMVLLKGEPLQAYNISNPGSIISIKELGTLLAKAGGIRLINEIPSNEDMRKFNPMTNSSLRADRLIGLGWKGCFNAETGLEHTVSILKDLNGMQKSVIQ